MRGDWRFGIAIGLLAAHLGCVTSREPHRDVPLVWVAEQEQPVATKANLGANRFRVLPLVDERQSPAQIGVNVKDASQPLPVTTRDDVAKWATERFGYVLGRQGFVIVQSKETVTLEARIVKLGVVEAGFFNGEVDLAISAKDRWGKVIWSGATSGQSKRWGRTNNLQNYYEALTNAFESSVRKLAEDPGFIAALPR
jgi:hypothetical protein